MQLHTTVYPMFNLNFYSLAFGQMQCDWCCKRSAWSVEASYSPQLAFMKFSQVGYVAPHALTLSKTLSKTTGLSPDIWMQILKT